MKKLTSKISVPALTIAISALLVCASIIGGTVAWLTAKTGLIENVFTIGGISMSLVETNNLDPAQTITGGPQNYPVSPGSDVSKDPRVIVHSGSVASYVFIKISESADLAADSSITYTLAAGWTQLNDNSNQAVNGVYYREVAATTQDETFHVLDGDKVTFGSAFTGKNAQGNNGTYRLSLIAYGIQKDNIATPYAGWQALCTEYSITN